MVFRCTAQLRRPYKGEEASKAIIEGAKIMAMTAIDMWVSSSLQSEVKAAFGDGYVPEGVL